MSVTGRTARRSLLRNQHDALLAAIRSHPRIREWRRAFHWATGLRITIADAPGDVCRCLPLASSRHQTVTVPIFAGEQHVGMFVITHDHEDPGSLSVRSRMRLADGVRLTACFARTLRHCLRVDILAPQHTEPRLVRDAKRYAAEHFSALLTSTSVAAHLNISPQHFREVFKGATRMTFTEFLTRLRLERAQSLLANRDLYVKEVAFKSGFHSIAQFNRSFKRFLDTSPRAFRMTANSM